MRSDLSIVVLVFAGLTPRCEDLPWTADRKDAEYRESVLVYLRK
jgi:hypothetical protein